LRRRRPLHPCRHCRREILAGITIRQPARVPEARRPHTASFLVLRLARVCAILPALLALSPTGVRSQTTESKALFDRWGKITQPLPGPPASIGFYGAGCLQGAASLPLDGTGYCVMRPSRRRFYGHPSLVSYLTGLAARTYADTMNFLLIGDMGPPRGGPMPTGHASHQDGLDADIWFLTRANRPSDTERERLRAPDFVVGRKRLRPTWGPAQARLLEVAADNVAVNRIFVSPPIKRYMCREFSSASWLYRLRPWWGHEEHFHVRLTCPGDSPLCREQDWLNPADNGCGAELSWWFSKEADREWARLSSSTEPRRFPELPAECSVMSN
jgi:penicillin-insensitive murein endopeptidase